MKDSGAAGKPVSAWCVRRRLATFVADYHHDQHHENPNELRPADLYMKRDAILERRICAKQKTITVRRRPPRKRIATSDLAERDQVAT